METNQTLEQQGQEQPTEEKIDIDGLSDRKLGDKFEKPNLDGKTIEIKGVELLPTKKVSETMNKKRKYEPLLLRIYYDDELYENYSGIRRFYQNEEELGEPTIDPKGKTQANKLFSLWLEYMNKNSEHQRFPGEVSLKEFLASLTGMKCKLKATVANFQGEEHHKNMIGEFI